LLFLSNIISLKKQHILAEVKPYAKIGERYSVGNLFVCKIH